MSEAGAVLHVNHLWAKFLAATAQQLVIMCVVLRSNAKTCEQQSATTAAVCMDGGLLVWPFARVDHSIQN